MAFSVFSAMPFSVVAADVGYYITGSMTGWGINADYKLEADTSADGDQYVIRNVPLTTASIFKITYTSNGTNINVWYPDGMGNDYGNNGEITADGNYDVYFRPNMDGGDGWFYGYIKVEPSAPQALQASLNEGFEDGKKVKIKVK